MRPTSIKTRLIYILTLFCLLTLMGAMPHESARATTLKRPLKGPIMALADPNSTITNMHISFLTHDDNKDFDTLVSVQVQDKVGFFSQDLTKLTSFAGSTEFRDNPPSTHGFDLPLVSQGIKLKDLTTAPVYKVIITPNGHDTWIFDVTLTITTSDGSQFSSLTTGVRLDQNNRIFNGTFN